MFLCDVAYRLAREYSVTCDGSREKSKRAQRRQSVRSSASRRCSSISTTFAEIGARMERRSRLGHADPKHAAELAETGATADEGTEGWPRRGQFAEERCASYNMSF